MRTYISFAVVLLLGGCIPSAEDEVASAELQKELENREVLLQELNADGMISFGAENAEKEIIVFTEFHCKYCMEFSREYLPALKNHPEFLVKIVPFTLNKYPNSKNINKGILCAKQLEQGDQMYEVVTKNQEEKRLTAKEHILEMEIDAEAFSVCMESEEVERVLTTNQDIAANLNIERVPTVFYNNEMKVGLPSQADFFGWIGFTE